MIVSAVQWSESAICTHIHPPSWTSLPPPSALPLLVITEHQAELPVLCNRFPQLSISYTVFVSIIISPHIPPAPSCPVSTNPSTPALYFLFLIGVSNTFKAGCATASHNPSTSPYFTPSENQSPYNSSRRPPRISPVPQPASSCHCLPRPPLLVLLLRSLHSSHAGLGPAGTTWHKPSGPWFDFRGSHILGTIGLFWRRIAGPTRVSDGTWKFAFLISSQMLMQLVWVQTRLWGPLFQLFLLPEALSLCMSLIYSFISYKPLLPCYLLSETYSDHPDFYRFIFWLR